MKTLQQRQVHGFFIFLTGMRFRACSPEALTGGGERGGGSFREDIFQTTYAQSDITNNFCIVKIQQQKSHPLQARDTQISHLM